MSQWHIGPLFLQFWLRLVRCMLVPPWWTSNSNHQAMTLKSVPKCLMVRRPIPLLRCVKSISNPSALLLTWADVLASRCHVKGETFKGDVGNHLARSIIEETSSSWHEQNHEPSQLHLVSPSLRGRVGQTS